MEEETRAGIESNPVEMTLQVHRRLSPCASRGDSAQEFGPARHAQQAIAQLLEPIQILDRRDRPSVLLTRRAEADLAQAQNQAPGFLDFALLEALLATLL